MDGEGGGWLGITACQHNDSVDVQAHSVLNTKRIMPSARQEGVWQACSANHMCGDDTLRMRASCVSHEMTGFRMSRDWRKQHVAAALLLAVHD